MQWLPYVAAYAGVAVFFIAVIARFFMWSKMPIHMRWELYPVAHEGAKASYGGSYMEETGWWKKTREVSLWGEVKVMVPEILFLVALKEKQPKLWTRSFPFHFGLYLVIACTVLLFINALCSLLTAAYLGTGLHGLVALLIQITGKLGAILTFVGALGLLHRRFTDPKLRKYSSPADFFNLAAFVVAFGLALVTILLVDRDFGLTMAFTRNLMGFNFGAVSTAAAANLLTFSTVILLSLLVAYIPLTHMSHFVGKYFAYHAIRWADDPNLQGGKYEKPIGEALNRPISWAAPHIKGDGKKTWAEAATEEQEKKK